MLREPERRETEFVPPEVARRATGVVHIRYLFKSQQYPLGLQSSFATVEGYVLHGDSQQARSPNEVPG